jgi:pimeloyl-ACP methyl ester carboxylesterase
MPPSMPELAGAEHSFHDLPTGVRVHLATVGPADAPPLLTLHGWPQHWWCWRDVIGALGGECVQLVGHDWGGRAAILAAVAAPERFSSLRALGIGHPWVPRRLSRRRSSRAGRRRSSPTTSVTRSNVNCGIKGGEIDRGAGYLAPLPPMRW